MSRLLEWVGGVVALAAIAGCVTPAGMMLADGAPVEVGYDRRLLTEDRLTVRDPRSGETFSGVVPGTGPHVTLGGGDAQHAVAGSQGAAVLLQGDQGGRLLCQVSVNAYGTGSGVCEDASGEQLHVRF